MNNKSLPKTVKVSFEGKPNNKFIRRYRGPKGGFGKVHNEYFDELANQLVEYSGRVKLDYRARMEEYLQYCDEGFTVGKAIRDKNGVTVRINGRISIPDLVDFKEDRIYDLKTIMWSLVFSQTKDKSGNLTRFTPEEVVQLVVHRTRHQLKRYLHAYWIARQRIATLMLSIEGFDRRIVCGFNPAIGEWVIVDDEVKLKTIEWWLCQD